MDTRGKIEMHEESRLLNRLSVLAFRFVYAIAAVAGIAVLAAGLLFFVRPKYRSIVDDIQAANTEKAELKDLMERYLGRLKAYNERYRNLPPSEREKLDYILPDGADQEFLFALFEEFARNQGLVLTSLKIGEEGGARGARGAKDAPAGPRPGLGQTRVTANFAGIDYPGMLKLLALLEGNLRFFDIEKVSFVPDQFTLGLEIATYYYK